MSGWAVHFLESQGDLSPWKHGILEQTSQAMERIERVLSVPPVDILYQRLSGHVIPEFGHNGYVNGIGLIFITLDPENPNFSRHLGQTLQETLAHEVHHCARSASFGYNKVFANALISEGLADHFTDEIFDGKGQYWDHALSEDQLQVFLRRVKPILDHQRYDYDAWFFGKEEDGIPRWTGYSLGYRIVQEYLRRNPDARASALHGTPTADILGPVMDLFDA